MERRAWKKIPSKGACRKAYEGEAESRVQVRSTGIHLRICKKLFIDSVAAVIFTTDGLWSCTIAGVHSGNLLAVHQFYESSVGIATAEAHERSRAVGSG